MTTATEVALLCDQIGVSIITKNAPDPHYLTELYNAVREHPQQYAQALQSMSSAAKRWFHVYCCLWGEYFLTEVRDPRNSADQLLEAAVRLIEIKLILDILGENHG